MKNKIKIAVFIVLGAFFVIMLKPSFLLYSKNESSVKYGNAICVIDKNGKGAQYSEYTH